MLSKRLTRLELKPEDKEEWLQVKQAQQQQQQQLQQQQEHPAEHPIFGERRSAAARIGIKK